MEHHLTHFPSPVVLLVSSSRPRRPAFEGRFHRVLTGNRHDRLLSTLYSLASARRSATRGSPRASSVSYDLFLEAKRLSVLFPQHKAPRSRPPDMLFLLLCYRWERRMHDHTRGMEEGKSPCRFYAYASTLSCLRERH